MVTGSGRYGRRGIFSGGSSRLKKGSNKAKDKDFWSIFTDKYKSEQERIKAIREQPWNKEYYEQQAQKSQKFQARSN